MLGMALEILPQIAAQATRHSWLAEVLAASRDWTEEQEERAEQLVIEWIDGVVKAEYPLLEDRYDIVRIVRNALIPTLEGEAISEFLKKNNEWADYLPATESAEEAATVAAMDMMASREEADAAIVILEMMETGEATPDKSEIAAMAAAEG